MNDDKARPALDVAPRTKPSTYPDDDVKAQYVEGGSQFTRKDGSAF